MKKDKQSYICLPISPRANRAKNRMESVDLGFLTSFTNCMTTLLTSPGHFIVRAATHLAIEWKALNTTKNRQITSIKSLIYDLIYPF